MSPVFLVALFTAVLAFTLYANLSEEVPRMCALGIVILCFVLDLILAPWPIQAMVLLAVLLGSKKLMPSIGTRS
jgi:hypothetical protein